MGDQVVERVSIVQKHVALVVETILVKRQPFKVVKEYEPVFARLLGFQKQWIHKSLLLETLNFCDETVYLFLVTGEVLSFKPNEAMYQLVAKMNPTCPSELVGACVLRRKIYAFYGGRQQNECNRMDYIMLLDVDFSKMWQELRLPALSQIPSKCLLSPISKTEILIIGCSFLRSIFKFDVVT